MSTEVIQKANAAFDTWRDNFMKIIGSDDVHEDVVYQIYERELRLTSTLEFLQFHTPLADRAREEIAKSLASVGLSPNWDVEEKK